MLPPRADGSPLRCTSMRDQMIIEKGETKLTTPSGVQTHNLLIMRRVLYCCAKTAALCTLPCLTLSECLTNPTFQLSNSKISYIKEKAEFYYGDFFIWWVAADESKLAHVNIETNSILQGKRISLSMSPYSTSRLIKRTYRLEPLTNLKRRSCVEPKSLLAQLCLAFIRSNEGWSYFGANKADS